MRIFAPAVPTFDFCMSQADELVQRRVDSLVAAISARDVLLTVYWLNHLPGPAYIVLPGTLSLCIFRTASSLSHLYVLDSLNDQPYSFRYCAAPTPIRIRGQPEPTPCHPTPEFKKADNPGQDAEFVSKSKAREIEWWLAENGYELEVLVEKKKSPGRKVNVNVEPEHDLGNSAFRDVDTRVPISLPHKLASIQPEALKIRKHIIGRPFPPPPFPEIQLSPPGRASTLPPLPHLPTSEPPFSLPVLREAYRPPASPIEAQDSSLPPPSTFRESQPNRSLTTPSASTSPRPPPALERVLPHDHSRKRPPASFSSEHGKAINRWAPVSPRSRLTTRAAGQGPISRAQCFRMDEGHSRNHSRWSSRSQSRSRSPPPPPRSRFRDSPPLNHYWSRRPRSRSRSRSPPPYFLHRGRSRSPRGYHSRSRSPPRDSQRRLPPPRPRIRSRSPPSWHRRQSSFNVPFTRIEATAANSQLCVTGIRPLRQSSDELGRDLKTVLGQGHCLKLGWKDVWGIVIGPSELVGEATAWVGIDPELDESVRREFTERKVRGKSVRFPFNKGWIEVRLNDLYVRTPATTDGRSDGGKEAPHATPSHTRDGLKIKGSAEADAASRQARSESKMQETPLAIPCPRLVPVADAQGGVLRFAA
ncbi:hypothetical protein P7C70_g4673, partial [Phenoliferia sp. Uapishka_3]